MLGTSARLLQLLSLLQSGQEWSADALALEMSITTRTVRRDVARLRDLGYPVGTIYGRGGGYQLDAGATLPPLMFDADEAASTVIALRAYADNPTEGVGGEVFSALEKLTAVMPARLRDTVAAVSDHSSRLHLGMLVGAQPVTTDVRSLILLARARREHRQVTAVYSSRSSAPARRRQLEPLHLVQTMGRWYLIAYCLDTQEWRTFRVDRMRELEATAAAIRPRTPPAQDLDAYVRDSISAGYRTVTATVRIWAAKEDVEHWILPAWGTVTSESPTSSIARIGADSVDVVARWLLLIGAPLTVIEPPELRAAFTRLAAECAAAAESAPPK